MGKGVERPEKRLDGFLPVEPSIERAQGDPFVQDMLYGGTDLPLVDLGRRPSRFER